MRSPTGILALFALLSLTSPLQLAGSHLEISKVLAQPLTTQARKAQADQLFQKGVQQFRTSQFREALETYQRVLTIRQELGNKAGIAQTLNNIGTVYNKLSQYSKALEILQQALAIRKELDDQAGEGETLTNLGKVYSNLAQYAKASETLQQALKIRKKLGDKAGEGETLNSIGDVYIGLDQYPKALATLQQALMIGQAVKDRFREGEALDNIGRVYIRLSQYPKALETLQQALTIHQEVKDRSEEATTLNNIGQVYYSLGQYSKALELDQQALTIARKIDQQQSVGAFLNNIAVVYQSLGQSSKALEFYQQALAMSKEIGDKAGAGALLDNIGNVYLSLGQYSQALDFFGQALVIHTEVSGRTGERKPLSNIGSVYYSLGQYSKALEFFQQALAINKEIGDRTEEETTLNNIAIVHDSLGQYPKALEFYQQALAIIKEIGHKADEGITLNNIGQVYQNIGQYPQALEFFQQALAIHKQVSNKVEEGKTLNNIGLIYFNLSQYSKSLEFYQQALVITRDIGNQPLAETIFNNIGGVYQSLGQYPKALDFFEQALAIVKDIGDKAGEGTILNNVGQVYLSLGQYPKALELDQQALAIQKEVGNKAEEGLTLSNIAYLLAQQKQPELAIVFYKQSVNVREIIRQDLRVLPKEQQQSYTKTVADTYRNLADLLLKQDRVLEAQQVLDLLKVQELQDYLRNVRGNNQTAKGVDLLSQEQRVSIEYAVIQDKAIALGKELTELRKIPQTKRTTAQEQRLTELVKAEETIHQEFNSFMKSPTVVALTQQLKTTDAGQNLALENLNKLRYSLRQLQQNAVLIYPLVLDDRLELVLVTAYAPPIHRSVAVKKEDLNKAILQFRKALVDSNSDAKVPAHKLFEWLIKPIEKDLTQAQAQTLIYAPDGQLRYIPLAALYDGKQWLVQRFRINNITAASLTELTTKPSALPHILAAAFSQGTYTVQVQGQEFPFSGLQFAGKEVEDLATIIPETTKLLNREFSRDATVPRLDDYNIIHLATHAAFVPGQPEDSFILFGNGDRVTLLDVGKWSLPDVDLVVLSACQTALGGQLGNGKEILGFGYQMQLTGARAAIASLWSVDDGGTQALMNVFYGVLQQNNVSKAEALRQAQIALINGNYKAVGDLRGLVVVRHTQENLPIKVTSRLSHPYYWAPFILIGNGL